MNASEEALERVIEEGRVFMANRPVGYIATMLEITSLELELRLKGNGARFGLAQEFIDEQFSPHIIFATITIPGIGSRIEVCRASRFGDASKQIERVIYT